MRSVSYRIGRARHSLRHRYTEMKSYCYDMLSKPIPVNQVRLLIFGQGRTGSTLLESLLCSTGYFRANDELLNPERGEILFPIQYIRGLTKLRANENFIFHLKIYQLTQDRKRPIEPAKFLKVLNGDGWKFIYLRRKNKVKHALSNIVAEYRGAWHKVEEKEDKFRLTIDCDDFVAKVKSRFRFESAEKNALADIKYHEVIYEDDLERHDNHQLTVDRILNYLSLDHRLANTKYRKVNTQSLVDLIYNYGEFVDCLCKENWQNFLRDDGV